MLTLSRKPLRRTKSFIERHVSITPDNIDLFADLESPVEEKGVGKEEKEAEETEQVASVPETSIAESRNSFDFGPTDDDWATHSAVDHERKVKGLPPLKRGKIVKGKRVVPTMNRTPSTSPESTTDEGRKSIDTGEILEVQLPDAPADSNESPTHHKKKKKKRRTANTEVSELGLATLQTGEEEAMQRYEEMQRRAEALTNALAMAMPGPDPVKPISTPPPPTQTLEKVSSSADSVASDRSSIDTIRTYESTESSWSSKRPKKTSWSWLMNLIRPSNSSSSSSTSSLSPSPPEITYYYPPEPTDETAGGYGPRYPLHLEKHIYAVSHTKLADQRRTLAEQVSISNLMLYIISVHADVTLKRRGPRRKKGKKKKKRRGMRELVSLESSGEPQHDGDGAAERMKDKHFREVFVGARTSSLGQVQVQVQVQHVQQPPAAQPQQQQQQHHQYGGGSFSFEPTEQYRPVSNNTNKATTSVPSVPVVAAGTPATSSSAPVTYTYTRWTSGFHSTGGNEDDFSGSDGDSDSSQESDDEEGEKKWSGYYWGGNSSVAVSDGGGGAYSPYLASPIQVSTVNEEEEDDLVPLGELKKRRQSPQR
ncbi:hypothetical protein BJ742DRAFT_838599 [Cladochytrium replicatum]|nr:hypothetical protein BJ742DRAFT_838599 [Cladochytrium replicatum]